MAGDAHADPPPTAPHRRADRPDLWPAWLARHGPALLLFARQWTHDRDDAEDAVQTAFVKFWQSRSARPAVDGITTHACAGVRDDLAYLYACVKSAALDLGRSDSRRQRREQRAAAPEACFHPSPDLDQDHRRRSVEQALGQLPPDQREVLVMKIWGGLTFAQIAAVLSLSPNTAASRYRLALERLSSQLSEVAHD